MTLRLMKSTLPTFNDAAPKTKINQTDKNNFESKDIIERIQVP